MIDHVSLPIADLERSLAFYTAALAPLGYEVVRKFEGAAAGLGVAGKPDLWIVVKPVGASIHVCVRAEKRSIVDAFYQAALAAGAKDNGPPGVRAHYHPHYYGAFVLDPDGHNVEACCHERYLA